MKKYGDDRPRNLYQPIIKVKQKGSAEFFLCASFYNMSVIKNHNQIRRTFSGFGKALR